MTIITLFHTNDLHGRLSNLARIATLVRHVKEAGNSPCLFLDAGDSEDTTLLESSLTKGSVMGTILKAAGCDVMTLGNSIPLRYGPDVIKAEADSFGAPILCANLFRADGSAIAGLEPYRFFHLGALKIAVIGVTAPIIAYQKFFRLRPLAPLEVMPGLVKQVRAQGAKLVIALTHIASPEDIKLAEAVPGIDLIIGGHDHVAITPAQQVNGCLIVQAGEYGKFLGRLDLDIDDETGAILSHHSELIPISDDLAEDPATLAGIQRVKEQTAGMMAHVVGRLDFPLELSFECECSAGDLLADALLARFPEAQFAFVLAGHWTNGLLTGEVTAGALFGANRSSANPALAQLTGEQVLNFMKNAMKPENACRELHALRGGKVGWPHVSGAEVIWDGSDLETLSVWLEGQPLDPVRIYRVAATDMEFAEFIGYLSIDDAQIHYEVPTIMPEVLQDHLVKHSPLVSIDTQRIKIRLGI